MLPGPEVTEAAAEAGYVGPLQPQAVLVPTDPGSCHIYTRLRNTDEDAIFIRITEEPISFTGQIDSDLLSLIRRWNQTHHVFLHNHKCYYSWYFPGEELEYKYMLAAGDIWTASVELYQDIRVGELSGYVPEYRDEFQTWDYGNHLFEIEAPESERGYVSFIPLVGGGCTVKRKWFTEDAFRRGERMQRESDHIEDFVEYVADRMGVVAKPLPPFRRVRYDVNFESLATGHVYGIFFDQSTIEGHPEHRMMQCELEYLRTRSVTEQSEVGIIDEMNEIAVWLESFLADRGFTTERGSYSKLSFLKKAVQENAALRATYA